MKVSGCAAEFYSYGVLHAAALGPLLLNQELGQLPRAQLEQPAIVHALATARAVRWVQRARCGCAMRAFRQYMCGLQLPHAQLHTGLYFGVLPVLLARLLGNELHPISSAAHVVKHVPA
jgi:hypothetical protein